MNRRGGNRRRSVSVHFTRVPVAGKASGEPAPRSRPQNPPERRRLRRRRNRTIFDVMYDGGDGNYRRRCCCLCIRCFSAPSKSLSARVMRNSHKSKITRQKTTVRTQTRTSYAEGTIVARLSLRLSIFISMPCGLVVRKRPDKTQREITRHVLAIIPHRAGIKRLERIASSDAVSEISLEIRRHLHRLRDRSAVLKERF